MPGFAPSTVAVKQETAHVVGIKPWKRWQIDPFLSQDYARIEYAFSASAALRRQARVGGDLIVWAAREPNELATLAAAQSAPLIRMEDGFLRSVGLGSNHHGGASLVFDPHGIYFDPRRPSGLEKILIEQSFSTLQLARAQRLRERLVEAGLSKYNVGSDRFRLLGGAGRRRILVPGQVENDASVRLGAPQVGGNLGLLERVRRDNPDAWILYKPHPDTEARTRPGWIDPARLNPFADQVLVGVTAPAVLSRVDEVHTMTSLMGFEALLRGLKVVVHGLPFYAGWGLTTDLQTAPARRTRKLQIDELVAAALIEYPRYVDPDSLLPCEVEDVVEALSRRGAANGKAQRSRVRRVARLGRGLIRSMRSRRRC